MELITLESFDLFLIIACAVLGGIILGFGLGWVWGFAKGQHHILTAGNRYGKRHL